MLTEASTQSVCVCVCVLFYLLGSEYACCYKSEDTLKVFPKKKKSQEDIWQDAQRWGRAKRDIGKAEEIEANPSRSFTTGPDVTIKQTDRPVSPAVLLFLTHCPPLPHPPHPFGVPPAGTVRAALSFDALLLFDSPFICLYQHLSFFSALTLNLTYLFSSPDSHFLLDIKL